MMHFIYICPKKWSELLLSIHLLSYACPSLVLRVAAPGVFVSSLPAVWIVYLMLTPRARYALLLVLLLLLSVLHAAGGLADCADRPYRSAASRAAAVPYSRGRRRRGRAWRSGGIR